MKTSIYTAHQTSAQQSYFKVLASQFLGLRSDQSSFIPEMPGHLQRLILRAEEIESPLRDQWDNWEHPFAENFQQNRLWIPEVDTWAKTMRDEMTKGGLKLEPLWPGGHPFAVCLTHDVDIISHTMTPRQRWRELQRNLHACDVTKDKFYAVQTVLKTAAKFLLRPAKSVPDAYHSLERSIDIEKEFGVSSSYFFTVHPLSRYSQYDCLYTFSDRFHFRGKPHSTAEIMRGLIRDGFDVGLHGSYFSATEPGMLSEQKLALENAINSPVATTRQHWLHFKHPLTPRLQDQAGFQADTTLGYNRNIGFRAGTSLPFSIFDIEQNKPLSLIEVPLIIQDGALMGSNALEHPPANAFSLIKPMIDNVRQVNGCVTFLFHPDGFTKPGMDSLYRQIIAYCLEQNAWVANLNELQKWWRERALKLKGKS